MGDSFLRAYLTIYDRTNNLIGFVGNVKSDPDDFLTQFWQVILITAGVTIVFAILAITACICCCCKSCKRSVANAQPVQQQ